MTTSAAPAAASELTTAEKATIRCVAAGTVVGLVTFFVTFIPSASIGAATLTCAMAAGEEAIASELEKK